MKYDVDAQASKKLLLSIDDEIEKKCFKLKQEINKIRMKTIFFSSCVFAVLIIFISILAGFSILNVLIPLLLFQSLALIFVLPFISNLSKGAVIDEKN